MPPLLVPSLELLVLEVAQANLDIGHLIDVCSDKIRLLCLHLTLDGILLTIGFLTWYVNAFMRVTQHMEPTAVLHLVKFSAAFTPQLWA